MVRRSSALAYYHETDEKGSKYTSEQRKSMPVSVEHFEFFLDIVCWTLDTDLDMVRPSSALAYYHETDEKGSKYTSEQRKSMPVKVKHFENYFCVLKSRYNLDMMRSIYALAYYHKWMKKALNIPVNKERVCR